MKYYTEVGLGNDSFISTEIGHDDGSEERINCIIVKRFLSLYIRIWLFKRIIILDTRDGFVTYSKSKNQFKFLFGIVSRD